MTMIEDPKAPPRPADAPARPTSPSFSLSDLRKLTTPAAQPWVASAALATVSMVANDMPGLVTSPAWVDGLIATPAWAAAAFGATKAVTWWHRKRHTKRPRFANAVCYGCAGWLSYNSVLDWTVMGRPNLIGLAGLGLAAAAAWAPRSEHPWMQKIVSRFRKEEVRGLPAPPPEPDVRQMFVEQQVSKWNGLVRKGNLAELAMDPSSIEIMGRYGFRVKLLMPVDLSAEIVESNVTRDKIARAWKVGAECVHVTVNPNDASEAFAMILKYNPLRVAKVWDGSGIRPDGTATIGGYISGVEVDDYRFYSDTGAVHDLITGCTGSGKSELVNLLLAMEIRHRDAHGRPLIASFLIDPQFGQSFGRIPEALAGHGHTMPEAREMLSRLEAEMFRRNQEMIGLEWIDEDGYVMKGVKTWRPSAETPLLSLTIDEAHMILADATCCAILARLLPMARKCGIKIRLITQLPVLSSLGNSSEIADAIKSGNIIILRSASTFTGAITAPGKLGGNPYRLFARFQYEVDGAKVDETAAGLCYVASDNGRTEMARTLWPQKVHQMLFTKQGEPLLPVCSYELPPPLLDEQTTAAGVPAEDPEDDSGLALVTAYLAARPGESVKLADLLTTVPKSKRTVMNSLGTLLGQAKIAKPEPGIYVWQAEARAS